VIPVQRAPEPDAFHEQVRRRGQRVLLELIGCAPDACRGRKRKAVAKEIQGIRPKHLRKAPLWTKSIPELRQSYRGLCAYLAMRIHPATGASTVDHFVPLEAAPGLAYEWSNYRLCSASMNTHKGEHRDVLDPFEVQPGWFVLDIPTFEVRPGADLDEGTRTRVQATIQRLRLNEPTYRDARAEYHDRCLGLRGESPLGTPWLERECPFVALELRRQGKLP
jgi:hypothetical protein